MFNDPIIAVSGRGGEAESVPALVMGPPNVIVETVKEAEDGDGVIVRLYECNRERGSITLKVGFRLQAAYLCNLLEENQKTLKVEGQQVHLHLRPYQIATLRLVPK